MSTGFAATDAVVPTEGVAVFECPMCKNIETDTNKLKWKVNICVPILLCCAIRTGWQAVETEIHSFTDIGTPLVIAASPPAKASSLVIDQSALMTNVLSLLNVEDASTHIIDAADEQMSQGPEDILLSDPGSLVDVS